jgi:hypothetical protein
MSDGICCRNKFKICNSFAIFAQLNKICVWHKLYCELGISVSIVSGYGLEDRAIEVRSPAEAKDFFPLTSVSRPALGPTQSPVQWVPGVLSQGITLTTPPSSAEVVNE